MIRRSHVVWSSSHVQILCWCEGASLFWSWFPRSRQFSDDPLPTVSFRILVNHSTSVHTERRRAISECEPLERRRRPGGYVSLSFAISPRTEKLLVVFVLQVDTESICFILQGRDERNAQQTREKQVSDALETRDFKRTKFQDRKCTQSIFCFGTWPFCYLACALHWKFMSFDSWTVPCRCLLQA